MGPSARRWFNFQFIRRPGAYARLQLWGRVEEWKYLRNERLVFSFTFSKGDGEVGCTSSVDKAI